MLLDPLGDAAGKISRNEGLPITINRVIIDNGSANFADLTLKPNFATGIHELNGSVKGLSSESRPR